MEEQKQIDHQAKLTDSRPGLVLAALAVSFGIGALAWILSPVLGRTTELWDSTNGYFPISLFLGGFIPGYLTGNKKFFWIWPIFSIFGQIIGSFIVAMNVGGEQLNSWPILLYTIPIFASLPVIIGSIIGTTFKDYNTNPEPKPIMQSMKALFPNELRGWYRVGLLLLVLIFILIASLLYSEYINNKYSF